MGALCEKKSVKKKKSEVSMEMSSTKVPVATSILLCYAKGVHTLKNFPSTMQSNVRLQLYTMPFLPIAFVKSFNVSIFPLFVAPNAIELKPIRNASITLLQWVCVFFRVHPFEKCQSIFFWFVVV